MPRTGCHRGRNVESGDGSLEKERRAISKIMAVPPFNVLTRSPRRVGPCPSSCGLLDMFARTDDPLSLENDRLRNTCFAGANATVWHHLFGNWFIKRTSNGIRRTGRRVIWCLVIGWRYVESLDVDALSRQMKWHKSGNKQLKSCRYQRLVYAVGCELLV